MKIKCRGCKRTVDAIIVKDYGIDKSDDPDQNVTKTANFRKLIIKDHRKSIWKSRHCGSSGKKITISMGMSVYDVQAAH